MLHVKLFSTKLFVNWTDRAWPRVYFGRCTDVGCSWQERDAIQEARLQYAQERCLKLNRSWEEPLWRSMSVNREKRVVACLVFKAGSTSWLRTLLRLTGNSTAVALANENRHAVHDKSHPFLDHFAAMPVSKRLQYLAGHYYRVLFVRDPLERFVSAYRDSMFRHFYYVPLRTVIKRMFRPRVSNRLTAAFSSRF